MKNSKEYTKKISALYRSLKQKHKKPPEVFYDEPLDAIVYAIISESTTESIAQSAKKRVDKYFIDINDLRVSCVEEIVEVLGENIPNTRAVAKSLIDILRTVFDKYNIVSLENLKSMGKRAARQVVEKTGNLSSFVIDYCMLTSLRAHSIPLTAKMIEYLHSQQSVHPNADEQQIEGFLTKQITAKNGFDFYWLLRKKGDSHKSQANKTVKKASKKTAKKTKAKKVEKKKVKKKKTTSKRKSKKK